MTSIVFVDAEREALADLPDWFSLNRPAWQIQLASSAEDAMELMIDCQFDCVISENNFPAISGAELFSHVAQHQPDAVRIAWSDSADAELRLETLHATHRYIGKPESPENICATIERALALHQQLRDEGLQSLINGISRLPVLPEIYDQLMLELASENFSAQGINRIIESDISLSVTLLKIVNSPFYGLVEHVKSPSHAVNLLGAEVVKNILLSEKVISQFKQISPGTNRLSQMNIQAQTRGVLANRFARVANLPKRQNDHCQMAGMLSAMGELVLETGMIEPTAIADTPYYPDLIGSAILGKWSLPDSIVEAVLHQSDAQAPGGDVSAMHVLHTIRLLENAYAANNHQLDDTFANSIVFDAHPLNDHLLYQWLNCFCDYHANLKIAA